jgi:hypothetical protein
MHKPVGHDGCLSMCKTPSPFRGGHFHDLPWPVHWAPMVFPDHHLHPVVMDPWVSLFGGREGIGGKVWKGLRNLSPKSANALTKTIMCSPSSHQTHGPGTRRINLKACLYGAECSRIDRESCGRDGVCVELKGHDGKKVYAKALELSTEPVTPW